VVDSEDLPLSVSRESVQATRIMANLKKTLTGKVLSEFKRLLKNKREDYQRIFTAFGRLIKQGIALSPSDRAEIEPLLLFASTRSTNEDDMFTLDEYADRFVSGQNEIYYVIGDDFASAARSPHLDAFRSRGVEVLYFIDPIDPLITSTLTEYRGYKLRNVDEADVDLRDVGELKSDDAPQTEALAEDSFTALRERFAAVLGGRVRDVRESKTLTGSAARLISDEASRQRDMYRINRLLGKAYDLPVKILELNPRHPLMHNLSGILADAPHNPLIDVVVEQVFETALLQEGIHPDPSAMAPRLLALMQAATGTPSDQLPYTPAPREAASANGAEE
jgi:HSP90 family molecular chaperone